MFRSELETFLAKFHQLWKDGYSAHLDVDAHAGQAWVGLRVMLGPCHQQQQQYQHHPHQSKRRRCPSYYRRQERRRAARAEAEEAGSAAENKENDDTSITIESEELSEASEDNSESVEGAIADKEAEEVSITKVSDEFRCEICDFTTNRRKELHIHISKKHAKIEQLDGNTTLCSESESDDDNNNPDGLDWDLIGQKLEEQIFLRKSKTRPWYYR